MRGEGPAGPPTLTEVTSSLSRGVVLGVIG
jgi:hypothetical protein